MFADQCKAAVAQARACLETCFVFLARVTSLFLRGLDTLQKEAFILSQAAQFEAKIQAACADQPDDQKQECVDQVQP